MKASFFIAIVVASLIVSISKLPPNSLLTLFAIVSISLINLISLIWPVNDSLEPFWNISSYAVVAISAPSLLLFNNFSTTTEGIEFLSEDC